MSDEADMADDRIESLIAEGVQETSIKARNMPKGVPGECEYCGGEFSRLVNGACGKCRDFFRLG